MVLTVAPSEIQTLKANPQSLAIDFDTSADLSEVNPQVMKWYDFMGPYGVGFHVPLIKFENVTLVSKKDLKGGHLKLNFSNPASQTQMDALLFSASDSVKSQIVVGTNYEILGELQWNYFNGRKTIQLLVKDLKPV